MNREELVEAMARAIFDAEYRDVNPLYRDTDWRVVNITDCSRERGTVWHHQAAAALPIVVAAVLDQIEALHVPHACGMLGQDPLRIECFIVHGGHCANVGRCRGCGLTQPHPCPTRRACDQIRAEFGGGEQ